ncbi:hypothetical protein C3432_25615 [Citrobacter amalonaticus]|uniref:DUF5710 domain-containing protein n=1 Tax=Citrobacter amalonaticus TaxID=35703 RepID=A0A2S4RR92_CITAM|nr:DUF5710 domain-containing protein [Citrobacter amalonaticus]POT54677.1 hypothetical protein C3432_25615 [Citrobacter amalonaticus]POT69885.1 hypothetical protein C3436_25410 [Citrobacter amalonaticus]POU61145.1 hypothetical protein C3430_24325 [Citrobacter amalonaticus]POV02499.1 hypothetical protein C3424_25655 [Citrobacter amalonaticus]
METTQTRTYLAVPHDEKDEARKAAGKLENNKSALRFDDERKVWYALPGADMEALKRWKPDPLLTGVSAGDALTQFTDFLHANGADVPDKVIMDGTRQRIRMRDDKPGKKSCTYVGHLDGLPNGWFNDFRDGGKDELSTWYFSGEEGDPVASLHMKAVTAQSQWDRAEAKRVLQDKKAGNVRYVHGKFGQAGHQHPYLVKKGVQAARGVHIDNKQRLLIPLQNADGVMRSMQTIDPEGNKRLTKDAEKSGNFFVVGGTLKNGRPIVCAEGYATAASGAMALRMPVVMAIDSGNLVKVAERLHQKYPDSPMLFLGDDDPPKPHRPGNPGKEAAEKAARLTGGIAVLPSLTPDEKAQGLTDFNDLHQSRGLAALTEELAPLRQKLLSAPTPDASPELQPTETVIMNEPDNVNSEPAGQAEAESQMAAYEDWMASGQDAIPETVQPEPVPAAPVAPVAAVAETAASKTLSPDSADGAGTATTVNKARRTKKTVPAEAKEKGRAKTATAPKKPRQKKVTTDDKPEKPQQAAPAAAESQSATRADPTPSLSSLLKQESPPASPKPALEDEEVQPVIPPVNEATPPLRNASPSGTEENDSPDNDIPISEAMPEPDGIRFERSLQARERIDLVALEGALLHRPGSERGTQHYLLDGDRAFTRYMQQGRIIMATPQASQNDRMILGALLVAKQDMVLQGNIELTGSPAFIQRAINLIAEYDLPLKLTNPEQIKMLEEAREKLLAEPGLPDEPTPLGSEASEILVHPVGNNTSAPRPSAAEATQAASTQQVSSKTLPPDILPQKAPAPVPMNASHDEASAGLTGTLLEHGPAPYNFQKDESHSYYARLRTAEGERIVWGIALRAAIADAGLENNDLVKLQMTGKETVTVDVKQKGPGGKPIVDEKGHAVYRKEERERNKWTARQAIDPTVVNADTRSMTPPGELLAYSLKDWNALQAGVEELAKKAGVSLPDWPGLPDALWTEPAGKGVPSPDRQPDNPTLPAPSRDAGKALFQAMDAEQQLKLLLVKAHGDYVQGVVLHDDVYKPVLGRLCKNARGAPHMTLNEITPDGLKPLGYGNPINNDTGSFNDYVFRLNNEPQRLYAQGLEPEKRTAALQQQLGFDSAPVAPDQLVVRHEPESTHRHTPSMPRPGR